MKHTVQFILLVLIITIPFVSGQSDQGRITEHLGDTTLAVIGLLSFAIIIRIYRKRNFVNNNDS